MARPRKEIDYVLVEKLAKRLCSDAIIADLVGMSTSGFHDRKKTDPKLSDTLIKGRANGKAWLHEQQMKCAAQLNAYMLRWLGIQHLGQCDRSEITASTRPQITGLEGQSIAELEKLADLKVIEGGK